MDIQKICRKPGHIRVDCAQLYLLSENTLIYISLGKVEIMEKLGTVIYANDWGYKVRIVHLREIGTKKCHFKYM